MYHTWIAGQIITFFLVDIPATLCFQESTQVVMTASDPNVVITTVITAGTATTIATVKTYLVSIMITSWYRWKAVIT